MARKKGRSSLSSSFTALSPPVKGVTEVELSDLEVYSSDTLISQSKPMSGSGSGGSPPSVFQKLESFPFGRS
jgi:hypothetical protein